MKYIHGCAVLKYFCEVYDVHTFVSISCSLILYRHTPEFLSKGTGNGVGRLCHDHCCLIYSQSGRLPCAGETQDKTHRNQ